MGVLHLIRTDGDFEFITNNPPSPPYALIVTPDLFTRSNILPLKNNPHVAGIVIVKQNRSQVVSFSQELQCPNQGSSYNDASCPSRESAWNPFGTGLMHESFPFPVYYIDDQEEIATLTECFEKFNSFDLDSQSQRSLCSIEIKQFMSASVNSNVCLRRTQEGFTVSPSRFCDPLSGKNVFATLYPREEVADDEKTVVAQPDEKFILVTARLDTTSMFDGLGVGAEEFISAATLISTAHILSNLLPEKEVSDHPNVLFVLFNGESYDYIGSQRFVYDMNKGVFPPVKSRRHPIRAESIRLHIDLGNLDDLSHVNVYHNREFGQVRIMSFLNSTNIKYFFNFLQGHSTVIVVRQIQSRLQS